MTANGSELFYWHTNKEWNKITKLGRIKEEKNKS